MRVTPPVVGALAVLLVLLGATQHAEAQGDWYTGRATFFGGDAWSIHKGSCLYGYLDGYTKTGWDVAALANANADFSGSCGRCYEVACQPLEFYDNYGEYLDRRGACRDPSASVVVQVVDACQCYEPSNPYSNQRWCCGDMYHMDLSIWAFSKLVWSPESSGVIGMRYRWVPCNYNPERPASAVKAIDNWTPAGWSSDQDLRPWP